MRLTFHYSWRSFRSFTNFIRLPNLLLYYHFRKTIFNRVTKETTTRTHKKKPGRGVWLPNSRNPDRLRPEPLSSQAGTHFEGSSLSEAKMKRGPKIEHHNPSLEFSLGRADWQCKDLTD
ncbi:hypothetical protein CXB51_018660 [Gossypium anomalum]|uniref:Uncharacterized protein n=1 Tax=Gossypium anomalum TaxID=47600 RepID=A0A8J5YW56_9ROSI|nr:hypothetical protein CXB51_018660 [Gossypium anomalum]